MTTTDTTIDDVAPQRIHDFADLTRAAMALGLAAVVMISAVYLGGITRGVESDAHTAAQTIKWLANVPSTALIQLVAITITVMVLANLLINREWVQTAASALSMLVGYAAVAGVSLIISNLSDSTLARALDSAATTTGAGLLPGLYAGMAAFLTVAGPRRTRPPVKWSWNILYVTGAIMVALSWHSITGTLVSLAIGRLVGMLIRFIVGTENKGVWGEDLAHALRDINLEPATLTRRADANDTRSAIKTTLDDDLVENSRIYDLTCTDNHRYIVSVLDAQSHSAGYLKQTWDWARFTGIAIRRDRSVRESVQHHLAMLLGLKSIGLPAMEAYGIADTDESAILVLDAQTPEHAADVSALTVDDAAAYMRYVKNANDRGFTHRRIVPDTLARLDDGTPVIAGWSNGDNASSEANTAVDKVQILTLFAALIGPDQAIEAAKQAWGEDTLVTIAPFIQKVAVPSPTRSLETWNNHTLKDLHASIDTLVDDDQGEPAVEKVSLARFSWRSLIAMFLLIVAVVVVFTQLKPEEIISALKNANPIMALVCLGLGLLSWIGSAFSLGALIDRDKRIPMGIFMSQVAGGFATVSMPAGVGPAFVNLQFLRKSGYRNTAATAVTSAVLVVYYVTYFSILVFMGIFTGNNAFSNAIPTNTLVIVVGVMVALVSIAMMIPFTRHLLTRQLLPLAKNYLNKLLEVLTRPSNLLVSFIGAFVQNITTGLTFWAALMAFGYHANVIETIFVFMLAYAVGSAVPTPGGLGAVEAALTLSFAAIGVPQGVALSATLLHRVVFYWLRIPLGALAMKWLDKRNLV